MYDDLSLQFTNLMTGESLQISRKNDIKLIEMPEGLEGCEYEQGLKERNGYDGSDYQYSRVPARDIALDIGCSVVSRVKEYRDKIIRVLNPKADGRLIVTYFDSVKAITYRIESVKDNTEGIRNPLNMHIELSCSEPFFETVETSFIEISTWIGGLKFPFKLPFHLKRRGEPRVNIVNNVHVETPAQIIFKGPAYHPTIKLLQTGEYITVKRELTSDDTLYIDTTVGIDSVEIEHNGVREDAFSAIAWQSDFFQLRVGDNLVEYTTENQLVPQSVEIRFRERYLGA